MTDLHQTCPRCAGERAHADDCTAALAAVVEALEGERREGESVADAVRRLRRERAEARGAHAHADSLFQVMADVLPDAYAAIEAARLERDRAVEARKRSEIAAAKADARLRAVLEGRALFGEALVVQAEDGSVWLQDPVKRDAGFGVRFDSLDDLWAAFPQLRPVRWDGGDLVVAAWRLPGGDL